jgi:hypothetical protein
MSEKEKEEEKDRKYSNRFQLEKEFDEFDQKAPK